MTDRDVAHAQEAARSVKGHVDNIHDEDIHIRNQWDEYRLFYLGDLGMWTFYTFLHKTQRQV